MADFQQRNMLADFGSPVEEFSMVPKMTEEEEAIEAQMPEAIQKPEFKQRKALAQTIQENPIATYEQAPEEKKKEVEAAIGQQFVAEQVAENPQAQPGSLKGKWLEALTYLAPQIGGALIGGVIGGARGVAAGYETGTGIRKQFDAIDQFNAKNQIALDRMSRLQKSEDIIDNETGEPLSYDPSSGKWKNSEGVIVPPSRLKNLRSTRESRLEEQGDERIVVSKVNARLRELGLLDKIDEDTTKKMVTAVKAVESNPVYKEAEKGLAETETIKALVKDAVKEGGQSLAMLGPRIAKGIAGEVGILTEQDVTRYVENPALVPKVADKIAKALGGRLTNNSAENILRLLDIMSEKNKKKMDDVVDKKSRVYGATTKDFNKDELKNVMTGSVGMSETEKKKARLEELRRKAGK